MLKKWILLFASVAILALLISVPFYRYWFLSNILGYKSVIEQTHYMAPKQRMNLRFGMSYTLYDQMREILKREGGLDPVILLPPDAYVQQLGIKDFHIVEPLEFYYFTGIKAVTIESQDVQRATWTLTPAKNPPLILVRIMNPHELEEYMRVFKKFLNH